MQLQLYQTNNPDRFKACAYFLARNFGNHLLRKLAPQAEVQAWAVEQCADQGFLHNGKPTRRARLSYVLKGLSVDPLRRFVEADTKSMIELYKLYDRLHGLDTGLTDEQLVAITLKN